MYEYMYPYAYTKRKWEEGYSLQDVRTHQAVRLLPTARFNSSLWPFKHQEFVM